MLQRIAHPHGPSPVPTWKGHAKSRRGIKIPKKELDLIRERLEPNWIIRAGASRSNRRAVARIPVERSSGNVFEDIGLAQSAELLVKSEIAALIALIIEKRGLTQAKAAEILGIDQPSVSDLVRGRLRGFSSDRLFRFLNSSHASLQDDDVPDGFG